MSTDPYARGEGIKWADYAAIRQPNGRWSAFDVPIHCTHPAQNGRRAVTADDLNNAARVLNQYASSATPHYMPFHEEHQDLRSPHVSAPLLGFLDNASVRDTSWGPVLYADLVELTDEAMAKLEAGLLPYLSPEWDPQASEIQGLAGMKSRPSFWPFPMFRVKRTEAVGAAQFASTMTPERITQYQRRSAAEIQPYSVNLGNSMDPANENKPKPQEDDETRMYSDEEIDAMEPAEDEGGEPAVEQTPAWAQQMLQLLQQLAGGQQAQQQTQQQLQASPPNTVQPLQPATPPAGQAPQQPQMVQHAKGSANMGRSLAVDDLLPNGETVGAFIERMGGVEKTVNATSQYEKLRGLDAEVTSIGGGDAERAMIATLYRDGGEKAAKAMVQYLKANRANVQGGLGTAVTPPPPVSNEAREQLITKYAKTPSERTVVQNAIRDWNDTMKDGTEVEKESLIKFNRDVETYARNCVTEARAQYLRAS